MVESFKLNPVSILLATLLAALGVIFALGSFAARRHTGPGATVAAGLALALAVGAAACGTATYFQRDYHAKAMMALNPDLSTSDRERYLAYQRRDGTNNLVYGLSAGAVPALLGAAVLVSAARARREGRRR